MLGGGAGRRALPGLLPLLLWLWLQAGAGRGQGADVSGLFPLLMASERAAFEVPADDRRGRRVFDFVIVGGGAAGCALAARLSERPDWRVLLLEAGGEATTPVMDVPFLVGQFQDTDVNWGFSTVPQAACCSRLRGGVCDYPQGRMLGGSTGINYMFNVRGNRRDFDLWRKMGNPGWGFEELLPYLKRAERTLIPGLRDSPYRGCEGSIVTSFPPYQSPLGKLIIQALQDAGKEVVDYNAHEQNGVSRMQTTTFNGTRWTAAKGYLRPARNRPNLFVRLRSTAVKLLVAEEGRVYGVLYQGESGVAEVYASREVIVCAGAVNTPKLLMLSGIGPRDHLNTLGIPVIADLPVGENLMDHAAFPMLFFTLNQTLAPSMSEVLSTPENYIDYIRNRQGPLTATGMFETVSFSELKGTEHYSPGWPDIEVLHSSASLFELPQSARRFGITEDVFKTVIQALTKDQVYHPLVLRLRPRSRGRVRLASADAAADPLVDPRCLQHPEDVEVTLAGVRELMRLADTPTFRRLGARAQAVPAPGCELHPLLSDAYWRCAIRGYSFTIYHPCGTCRMGPAGDAGAVVGPDLKVRGLSGLRVADASVMPQIVSGHLQMACYAIGEKASDLVKQEHSNVTRPRRIVIHSAAAVEQSQSDDRLTGGT